MMQFSLPQRGRRWIFSALALFCTTVLSAQMLDIRGIVTDEAGEPLAGVTIRVVGVTDRGASTDAYGSYTIKASNDRSPRTRQ